MRMRVMMGRQKKVVRMKMMMTMMRMRQMKMASMSMRMRMRRAFWILHGSFSRHDLSRPDFL